MREVTRDPDSGKGRRDRPHQDWSGKDPTRPGPHVPALDDTIDEFPGSVTPVEHLRARVDHVAGRMSEVEATIDMPSWDEFKAMRVEVQHCAADRIKRERRAKWIAGAALAAAGTIATGAVAIVRALNESTGSAAVAADRFDTVRRDVSDHAGQLKAIGEILAGHAATIDMLKRDRP